MTDDQRARHEKRKFAAFSQALWAWNVSKRWSERGFFALFHPLIALATSFQDQLHLVHARVMSSLGLSLFLGQGGPHLSSFLPPFTSVVLPHKTKQHSRG